MTNIKIMKDVYSKYIFSINLILLNCIDVFNVNSIDTYNINFIL